MSVVKPAIQFPVLIAYLEGANNYTWLHFRDGEKLLLAKPLSYLDQQPELSEFIRIHKTVLINPACVERVLAPPRTKMAGALQMESGVVLPVSRRRWSQVAELLPEKLVVAPDLRERLATLAPAAIPGAASRRVPPRLVMIVTDNALDTLLVAETADRYWPHCTVHLLTEAWSLPALLDQLPPDELPVFVLLDARTARQERLNTLLQLKRNKRLGWIPVVLMVTSAAEVQEGYYRQANSVIAVGKEHTQLVQTLKRIGQFWLETVALPGTIPADV